MMKVGVEDGVLGGGKALLSQEKKIRQLGLGKIAQISARGFLVVSSGVSKGIRHVRY